MKQKILKPQLLNNGDTIGLIAPASPVTEPEKIENAVNYLQSKGFKVKCGNNIYRKYGYLAGEDEERLADLHQVFQDNEIKAVFCLRGGYGSARLLHAIDYKLIRKHPKIFIGYSDVTALQSAFFAKAGLLTFSGPMPAVDFQADIDPFTETAFWELITTKNGWKKYQLPDENELDTLNKGKAEGTLIGGNLSLLTSLIGTPYLPHFAGNILFIEEIAESPYRVDRMLNQLALSGLLKKTSGVILGAFTDCVETEPGKPTLELAEIFQTYLGKLKIPVLTGFPNGHIKTFPPLVYGVQVKINCQKKTFKFSESPFA